MEIGEKIKYYRINKGLTQKELAHGICSIPYLSKIENKKILDNPDILNRLCEKLEISYEPDVNQDDSKIIETITKHLNEWYKIIKDRDKEKALKMDKTIRKKISKIDDLNINIQYKLFSLRYHLLFRNYHESKKIIQELKSVETFFTDQQQYYFYYFYGLYQYLKDKFQDSLKYFSKAKNIDLNNYFNEPELIYLLALVHSRLHHITLAIKYADIALDLFNQNMDILKSIETQIILAINYTRLQVYDRAENYLFNSLKVAEQLKDPYLIGKIYHNLGYLYSNLKQHGLAIEYYQKSLILVQNNVEWYTNTVYYLVEELFIINQLDEAMKWIEKALEMADENDNNHIKIKAIKSLHILATEDINKNEHDKELIYIEKTVIPFFQKKQDWNEVSHYAEQIANYYANKKYYRKASDFYKLANDARKNILV